jgi:hypothetical protein
MDNLLALCGRMVELHDTDLHPDHVDTLVEKADIIAQSLRATGTPSPRTLEDLFMLLGSVRDALPEDFVALMDKAEFALL